VMQSVQPEAGPMADAARAQPAIAETAARVVSPAEAPAALAATQGLTASQAAVPKSPATAAIKGDAFIPPRPIEPNTRRAVQPTAADPFATADLMNAGPAPEKPKRRSGMASLFGRVTGAGQRRAQQAEAAAQAIPAQTSLGGLDPKERVKMSEPDDDLLDIPAFLRRQAN